MERYLIHDFGADQGQWKDFVGDQRLSDFGREPIIRRMKDGRIVCTFLTGGPREPDNANVVKLAYSDDDGRTWSEPETIHAHGCRAVWCTELFNEGEFPFLVVMTYNADCQYRELQPFFSFSRDDGRTWEEPVSIPGGLSGTTLRQGIVMSNGEWLFPMYWQEVVGHFDWTKGGWPQDNENGIAPWHFCCGVTVSSDQGKTFQRYGYLADKLHLWEPNCIELEPGHIVMLMRDNANAYLRRSDSYDYGRTWSEMQVTDLPNPNTKVTLLKVNGKTLLINNFSTALGWAGRCQLGIWVSSDNMQTWETKLPIAPPEERFFYPHAFADDAQQMLYVAYENARQHYLCRIPYAELGL